MRRRANLQVFFFHSYDRPFTSRGVGKSLIAGHLPNGKLALVAQSTPVPLICNWTLRTFGWISLASPSPRSTPVPTEVAFNTLSHRGTLPRLHLRPSFARCPLESVCQPDTTLANKRPGTPSLPQTSFPGRRLGVYA